VHAELFHRADEEPHDVDGAVAEHVAGVLATVDPVDHPTPVGLDQPPEEAPRVSEDDLVLPVVEDDQALVLPARAVLREQTPHVLPVGRDDDVVVALESMAGDLPRKDGSSGGDDASDDPRVLRIREEPDLVDVAATPVDRPVAEVLANR
jgi:hypothetical protein